MDAEQTLLQRARALEGAALAEVFDAYYVPLYRYIYYHVGHRETAEDLAAEVFERLLAQLHEGGGPQVHLKPWLFRVAHNIVVDDARRQVHRKHQPLDAHLPANVPPVDEQAHQAILSAEVRQALQRLTPKQRSVIILKFLLGMDNAEVAHALTLPVGSVKSLQHRGLAALRRNLSRKAWGVEGETP